MSDNSFNSAAEAVPEQVSVAPPESVESGAPQGGDSGEPQEPKTFTQDELDDIVAKRVAKAERKLRREQEQMQVEKEPAFVTGEPPNPKDFDSPVAYAEALADHKVAERDARVHQTKLDTSFDDRLETFVEEHPDFDQVVRRMPADGGPSITTHMSEVIKASEVGPQVAYHLGKNVAESRRIANLPPLQQAKELGKIEATLTANPPVKKVSSTPDPISPVRRGSNTPTYDPTDPRSVKMDPSDWIKARNEQMAKRAT